MSKPQRPNSIHVDMTKGVWLHAYKLPNQYAFHLPEEIDYRLEIDGYNFALTKNQFETLHDARIQVWDDGAKAEQERMVRRIKEEFPKLLKQHGLVIIPEVFDYFIEQIKQHKMSDHSDKLDTPEE